MNEQLVKDLSQHAINTCNENLNRITSLCRSRNEAISVIATTGICIINNLIQNLREVDAPPEFINELIESLRDAIDNHSDEWTEVKEKTNV